MLLNAQPECKSGKVTGIKTFHLSQKHKSPNVIICHMCKLNNWVLHLNMFWLRHRAFVMVTYVGRSFFYWAGEIRPLKQASWKHVYHDLVGERWFTGGSKMKGYVCAMPMMAVLRHRYWSVFCPQMKNEYKIHPTSLKSLKSSQKYRVI